MNRWRSAKALASWLGVCPNNRISGGKILSSRSRACVNRAAKVFRMAAYGLHHAKSALGAYYRRMRTKLGAPKAITATAHKLARLFYSMLRTKKRFADLGQDAYERLYQARRLEACHRPPSNSATASSPARPRDGGLFFGSAPFCGRFGSWIAAPLADLPGSQETPYSLDRGRSSGECHAVLITSVPSTAITYNTAFTVNFALSTNRTLQSACLIAPGSVTHSHDPNQRLLELPITNPTATSAQLTPPANPTKAPRGYYMLFIVDNTGAPSAAAWVQLL